MSLLCAEEIRRNLSERDGHLPVWVRCPTRGAEHYTGFRRSKLYELANAGLIRSTSIRKPGQIKGVRLFHLGSLLDYIDGCEKNSEAAATCAARAEAGKPAADTTATDGKAEA